MRYIEPFIKIEPPIHFFFISISMPLCQVTYLPMSPWLGTPSSPRSFCISHQAIGILV